MKLIIEKSKNLNLSELKKKWKDEEKVLLTTVFEFHQFEKKKKNISLALDFVDLPVREIPPLNLLKNLDFVVLDNLEMLLPLLKKKKKVIYIFRDLKKDLKYIFENFSKTEISLFLRNTYFEIQEENYERDNIFRKIVFLKKEFSNFISTEKAKKINILLKNNFSTQENINLLEDKILKLSGVVISKKDEE